MATYNGEQYIRRQLDSLAAQTLLPAELIIADDKSDDNTIAVIETFAKSAPFPVKIFRNGNRLGYRNNFMHAANLCQSEFVAFCDQDDYWQQHKIEASVKPFSDAEVLLTYHNADVVAADGERIGTLTERVPRQQVLPALSSGPWLHALGFTEVFRRSLLQWSDLWPRSLDQDRRGQPLAHDQWFFFLASALGTIVYIDEPLVAYVQHGANTYGWGKPDYGKLWKSICATIRKDFLTLVKPPKVARIFSKCSRANLKAPRQSEPGWQPGTTADCRSIML